MTSLLEVSTPSRRRRSRNFSTRYLRQGTPPSVEVWTSTFVPKMELPVIIDRNEMSTSILGMRKISHFPWTRYNHFESLSFEGLRMEVSCLRKKGNTSRTIGLKQNFKRNTTLRGEELPTSLSNLS